MNNLGSNFVIILLCIGLVLEVGVLFYSLKLLKVAKYLKFWYMGWAHFSLATFLIIIRRIAAVFGLLGFFKFAPLIDGIITIIVSMCYLWFVYCMAEVFRNLCNGEMLKIKGDKGDAGASGFSGYKQGEGEEYMLSVLQQHLHK